MYFNPYEDEVDMNPKFRRSLFVKKPSHWPLVLYCLLAVALIVFGVVVI